MMKKIVILVLVAALALTGVLVYNFSKPVVETETTLDSEFYVATGTVIEITDQAVTFTDLNGQVFQANIGADTVQEYDLPGGVLSVGDFVTVMYDGKMTRSIPAQITALVIRSSVREGVITSVSEDHFMLKTELEEIQVNCTADQLASLAADMQVKVYFSGAMTMSLPAQIGAELIVAAE